MARDTLKDFLTAHPEWGATGDRISITVDKTGGTPGISGGEPQGDGLGEEPNTGQKLLDLENSGTGIRFKKTG